MRSFEFKNYLSKSCIQIVNASLSGPLLVSVDHLSAQGILKVSIRILQLFLWFLEILQADRVASFYDVFSSLSFLRNCFMESGLNIARNLRLELFKICEKMKVNLVYKLSQQYPQFCAPFFFHEGKALNVPSSQKVISL